MKIGYLGQGEDARMVEIEPDAEGDAYLGAMQSLVGGLIEPFDVLWDDGVYLVVNEEGIMDASCRPSAVMYANAHMEEAGYLDQLTCTHPVREDEFYAVLFGPVLVVAEDPETGEPRDLTDAELARAASELIGDGGVREMNAWLTVELIRARRDPGRRPVVIEAPALASDAASAREASEAAGRGGTPAAPDRETVIGE